MDSLEEEIKGHSLKALTSAISKMEKGLETMEEKGANTKLMKRRLRAVMTGKRALEGKWLGMETEDSLEMRAEAACTLKGLIPLTKRLLDKMKERSPQRTLLERRLIALDQAIQALENRAPQKH